MSHAYVQNCSGSAREFICLSTCVCWGMYVCVCFCFGSAWLSSAQVGRHVPQLSVTNASCGADPELCFRCVIASIAADQQEHEETDDGKEAKGLKFYGCVSWNNSYLVKHFIVARDQ